MPFIEAFPIYRFVFRTMRSTPVISIPTSPICPHASPQCRTRTWPRSTRQSSKASPSSTLTTVDLSRRPLPKPPQPGKPPPFQSRPRRPIYNIRVTDPEFTASDQTSGLPFLFLFFLVFHLLCICVLLTTSSYALTLAVEVLTTLSIVARAILLRPASSPCKILLYFGMLL